MLLDLRMLKISLWRAENKKIIRFVKKKSRLLMCKEQNLQKLTKKRTCCLVSFVSFKTRCVFKMVETKNRNLATLREVQ